MTRAVGNGLIQTLANAIGTGAVGKLAKQVAGLSTDVANLKTPEKGSGLMFNPDTGKLYIPCGNGVTVNKNTGMLEVPIGDNLRYTGSGLDVPDADETTAGVVKLTHEVSNRDDGEWAITADGVYAYAPGYKSMPVNVHSLVTMLGTGTLDYAYVSNGLFICRIADVNVGVGESIIALAGYDTPINIGLAVAVTPDTGTPTNLEVNLVGGGAINVDARVDVSAGELYITMPVYKL